MAIDEILTYKDNVLISPPSAIRVDTEHQVMGLLFDLRHQIIIYNNGLHSSILQCIQSIYLATLQDAVTYTRNLESAKLKTNYTQATSNAKSLCKSRSISTHLPANDTATYLSTIHISTSSLSTTVTNNISTAATTTSNTTPKPHPNDIKKPQTQSHPKLEIGNGGLSTDSQFIRSSIRIMSVVFEKDATSNNQKTNHTPIPTNNIPPSTITKNKLLNAIFLFELKEPSAILLFSRAILEEKPITVMYTDVKVDGHFIKLILDSGSAGSIITRQLINQLSH
ncbi:hypothetical protein G9A89_008969 [Geosiphon pyriformis]|nr:hypothetical protein G9A89_008969 [Geosiphon pyriformis]